MADQENSLLAIEVDADNYAETAAGDVPSVSRTYQSEADFQAQKATYTAKIDGGKTYQDLITAVPILEQDKIDSDSRSGPQNGHLKVKLSKKDVQLLGYAVGELYYDKEYRRIVDLCERIARFCDTDEKTEESLRRWTRRCHERLS